MDGTSSALKFINSSSLARFKVGMAVCSGSMLNVGSGSMAGMGSSSWSNGRHDEERGQTREKF